MLLKLLIITTFAEEKMFKKLSKYLRLFVRNPFFSQRVDFIF